MLTIGSVLCPVDFSEQSRQALLWASAITHHRGAQMTVLSVVEPLLAEAAGIRLGVDLAQDETGPALCEFGFGSSFSARQPSRCCGALSGPFLQCLEER